MRFLSLFSGLEAASEAWLPLGWSCAAVAEIDAFPSAVLAHHYPDVPNLGDVKKITEQQIADLGPLDLVVFGFPCQDLSVAGKRKGLIDDAGNHTRSGLFFRAMQIVRWAERNNGCRLALAENVPGLFSRGGGADFATVLGEMAGAEFAVPKTKWKNTGLALGRDGLVEWAVLDAQWFGVPQRRRRVFIIRDTGDWGSRPPILFERESLQGNSPPSRETRQVAPSIPSRRTAGGGFGTNFDCDGGLIPSTGNVSHCLNAGGMGRQDYETETLITHSLRADGFDASEDGTGRGTPLVPVAIQERACCENPNAGPDGIGVRTDGVAYSLEARQVPQAVAVSCKDHGADAGDLAPTLRSMGHDGSHANAGGQVAVAFAENQRGEIRMSRVSPQLSCAGGKPGSGYPAVAVGLDEEQNPMVDGFGCLKARKEGGGFEGNVMTPAMAVRRLTPKECERLQGFPDDYTQVPYRNKPAADGPRYKALGNSMAVPCMRWIGMQLEKVHLTDKGLYASKNR